MFLVAVSCLLTACSVGIDKGQTLVLDWDEIDADSINYSQFVDSISYIELETTDSSLIGNVDNLRISDDGIVVFDKSNRNVLSFSNDGKFRSKIGSYGGGPQEYAYLNQIDIDPASHEILLFDTGKERVLRYSYDGLFHSMDSVSRGDDFSYIRSTTAEGYLLACYGYPSEYAGIFFVDRKSGVKHKLMPRKYSIESIRRWEIFKNDSIVSVMTPFYDNRMLEWDADSLKVILEFDSNYLPDGTDKPYIGSEITRYYSRMWFVNGSRWYLANYTADNGPRFLFWDKTTEKPIITKMFVNDIDQVPAAFIPYGTDDSFIAVTLPLSPDDNPRIQILHLKK